MANKNSIYLTALADFIKDTKPYHTKLAAVDSVYQFSEDLNVKITERTFTSTSAKSAWSYPYFSSGVSSALLPAIPMHRIVNPQFRGLTKNSDSNNLGSFKVSRDENTDLPLVPFAFDPKSLQGPGLADTLVQRNGLRDRTEGLVEGHDVFLSHGAYVFQIQQNKNSSIEAIGRYTHDFVASEGPFPITVSLEFSADSYTVYGDAQMVPGTNRVNVNGPGNVVVNGFASQGAYNTLFTEKQNEDLILSSTIATQYTALDKSKVGSSINKILALLARIQSELNQDPDAVAQAELNNLLSVLNSSNPILPKSYEALMNALVNANISVPSGFSNWKTGNKSVLKRLSSYSPPLYFNEFNDIGIRDSGNLNYKNISGKIKVTNIFASSARTEYEEYTIRASTNTTFLVSGSFSGTINAITLPDADTPVRFTSNQISFDLARTNEVQPGDEVKLAPSRKITIHESAPLEAWSLIKVNPIAYTRPVFNSTRYGYVSSSKGNNYLQIIDPTWPAGTIILEAISENQFRVKTTGGNYTSVVNVNTNFNDGKLAFTIKTGSTTPFSIGDRFYAEIKNDPAAYKDLDLSFGYDMGPFDADEIVYNTINSSLPDYLKKLEFGYDSRFINYDLTSFNLRVSENAENNKQWRLRAVPDESRPLPLQNTTPKNIINQLGTNDPTNPNAVVQLDMANNTTSEGNVSSTDNDTSPDILVYYASKFALEFFNEDSGIWSFQDFVNVDEYYSNADIGLSFNLIQGTKPFISTRVTSSYIETLNGSPVTRIVDGGDVISFSVSNAGPEQLEPINLSSVKAPRLVMHGDSYHDSHNIDFNITFLDEDRYSLNGIYTDGTLVGNNVYTNKVLSLSANTSYQDEFIHFSIKPGNGLGANDNFKVSTFDKRPSYLVYGSVSGWQPNATVGEWYWNGKIGFKITKPKISVHENGILKTGVNNSWDLSIGTIKVSHLRFDTEDSDYEVKCSDADGHWLLTKNGVVVSHGKNLVQDKFISIELPDPSIFKFGVFVEGDEHKLFFGQDLAIIRSTAGRMPTGNDFVLFERTEKDELMISIKPRDAEHTEVLKKLYPVNTDIRYVDHNANSGVPLSFTSPETDVLQGWIPLDLQFKNNNSDVVFSDQSTSLSIFAAGTGESIGQIAPVQTDLNKVLFTWNPDFHNKYLPLNAECTFVALSAGLNDLAQVHIKDGVTFLFSGGGLDSDALFADEINVQITGYAEFKIKNNYQESVDVHINDGPFTGFLTGYDNLPFDQEVPDGAYDVGSVLTARYERAKELFQKIDKTDAEKREYQDCLALIDPYLSNGIDTTFEQFIALRDADVYNKLPAQSNSGATQGFGIGFGIPDLGHGIEVQEESTSTVGSKITENISLNTEDNGYPYDRSSFGVGLLDQGSTKTGIVHYTGDTLPIPASGLPGTGVTYQDYDTPLWITQPVNSVELNFPNLLNADPLIYIWGPLDTHPYLVTFIQKLSSTRYKFSVPYKNELKISCVTELGSRSNVNPTVGFNTTVKRFTPRLFYVDGPRSMSFALTTDRNSLRVDYTARMTNDLCGLIWQSEDTKDHYNLAYGTNKDYRGTVWSFDLQVSDNSPLLDDEARSPSLTIEALVNSAPVTYIVPLFRYAKTPSSRKSKIILDFDTIKSGFFADQAMDLSNVSKMFISITAGSYNGAVSQPLPEPISGWIEITNCFADGPSSTLPCRGIEIASHGLGMCTSYDDHYDQSPERIVMNSIALGYTGRYNHYCGMSIYPEKTWTGSRLEVINPGTSVDVVSLPTRKWHENYAKVAASNNISLIYSVSYEMFSTHARYEWTQRDYSDNFAETGYTPSSFLLSPGITEAMDYLKSVFVSFGNTLKNSNVPVVMQVGEPWWWYNPSTNKPCIYDYPTKVAFNNATGLYAPEFTDIFDNKTDSTSIAFKNFLQNLLGSSVQSIRDVIKGQFPGAKVSVLPFFPTIIGKGIMEQINYPLSKYAAPNFDFFQLECYDWIIEDNVAKADTETARLIAQLGYTPDKVEYLAGFAPETPIGQRLPIWKRIIKNIDHNQKLGLGKQHIWAYTLVMRDAIVLLPATANPGALDVSGFFYNNQYVLVS